MVGLAVMLGMFAPKAMKAHPLLPQSNVDRAGRMGADALQESPALKRFIESQPPDQVSAAIQAKTHAGLKRLSYEDLVVWNEVRLQLAAKSPQLCAGFWTGNGLTPQLLTGTLEQLPQDQSDAFFRTTMRAAVAEVEDRPFNAPPADAFGKILPKLKQLHGPADNERLDKVLAGGVKVPDGEACWAMQLLMKDAAQLQRADRETFLRFVASL